MDRSAVSVDHPRFSPGALVVGKYRVERALEKGGMSFLVVATHEALQQPVAIKYLMPAELSVPGAKERFIREGRAAVKLESPHAVRILDVDVLDDGTPFMVMELLNGLDLSALVEKRGRLPVTEAVGYVLQALDALSEAHACGIVHRDLKPSNLFLASRKDGSHIIKVLDFGISKVITNSEKIETLTHARTLMGTPLYMSPEQIRDAKSVDARSDIWSLGVILYYLLSGAEPFGRSTIHELLFAVLEAEPEPLHEIAPNVPAELEAVVARCLKKRREERFASCAELSDALAPFADGASVRMVARGLSSSRRRVVSSPRLPPSSEPRTPPSLTTEEAEEETQELQAAGGRPNTQDTLPLGAASGPSETSSRFRVIAQLGQGAIATVYLATTGSTTPPIVLKRLHAELAAEPDFLRMFLDEARIAASIRHPNVVETKEVGFDGDHHFIAMEYLEGPSLEQMVRRAERTGVPFPCDLHVFIISEALAGLHHAHELRGANGAPLNIVHRDISPQNILITGDGRVKLIDFGIAKAADSMSQTRTGAMKGKYLYMAPEQFRREHVDRRTDIFAAGVLLWQAATGRPLWHGLSELEVIDKLSSGQIPSPRDVNPNVDVDLARICMRALAPRPEDRYATAADLRKDLAEYLAGRATTKEVRSHFAQVFEDRRAEIRLLVESGMRAADTGGKIPVVSWLGTQRGSLPDLPSGSAFRSGSSPRAAVPPEPSRSRGKFLASIAAAMLAFALVGVFAISERRSRAVTPAPEQAQASVGDLITLTVRVSPESATAFVDDVPLVGNPATVKLRRDGASHRIRGEAAGHVAQTQLIPFDTAVLSVQLMLQEAPSAPAASSVAAAASTPPAGAHPPPHHAAKGHPNVVALPTPPPPVEPPKPPPPPATAEAPKPRPSNPTSAMDRDDPYAKKP